MYRVNVYYDTKTPYIHMSLSVMNKVSGKIVDEICKDPKNSTGLCMAYWDFDMGPTGYFIPNSKSP